MDAPNEADRKRQWEVRRSMFLDSLVLHTEVYGKEIEENDKVFLLVSLLVLSILEGGICADTELFESVQGKVALRVYGELSERISLFTQSSGNRAEESQKIQSSLLYRLLSRVTDHTLHYYESRGTVSTK